VIREIYMNTKQAAKNYRIFVMNDECGCKRHFQVLRRERNFADGFPGDEVVRFSAGLTKRQAGKLVALICERLLAYEASTTDHHLIRQVALEEMKPFRKVRCQFV
jgi:hypothetical protein